MVNLVFHVDPNIQINLPGNLDGPGAIDEKSGTLRARVVHRSDYDQMVDQSLIGLSCQIEFPDNSKRAVVFQSIPDLKEGFIFFGRLKNEARKNMEKNGSDL